MKALLTLAMTGLLVVSTIGLSGEGPVWTKYVGAGMVFVLLMLILTGVSNIPSATDLKKMLMGVDPAASPKPMPVVPDDDDDLPSRRSARN
jgi:FtsH-binding integral membrane protein